MDEDLTPKLHELRFLKAMLPQLKRKAQSKSKKLYIRNGMIDPVPCVICGFTFDRYNSGKEKHENCPSCRKKLEAGQTCVICKVGKDGLYDGRHAWLTPDDHPMAQQMAGKVIGVESGFMDAIILKDKLADLKDSEYIVVCEICKKETIAERCDDSIPKDVALIQTVCTGCVGNTPYGCTNPLYFDKDLNPVIPEK